MSNDKIILPVKQYSNKFLRDNKDKDEFITNHNIFKPKKSVVFNRKQLRNRRNKQIKIAKRIIYSKFYILKNLFRNLN